MTDWLSALKPLSNLWIWESKACVWICRGTNVRYRARVRWEGYQRYNLVGPPTRSYRVALIRMAKEFATGRYKRGDVIMTADYYDPVQVCELTR